MKVKVRPIGVLSIFFFFLVFRDGLAQSKDQVLSWTSIGGETQIQSFEASRHFRRAKTSIETAMAQTESQNWADDDSKLFEIVPLYWLLGATAGRAIRSEDSFGSGVTDYMFGFYGGLTWEILHNLEFGGKIGLDRIPGEGYRRGNATLQLGYTFYFGNSEPSRPVENEDADDWSEYDPTDAREYYSHQAEVKRERAKLASAKRNSNSDAFPQLKITYKLEYYLSHVDQRNYRLESLAGFQTSESTMNQGVNTIELSYSPNRRLSFSAGFGLYTYDSIVDSFLNNIEIGNALRQWHFGNMSGVSNLGQALTFPNYLLNQSIVIHLKSDQVFQLNVVEVSYSSIYLKNSYTFNPAFYKSFGSDWVAGLGLHYTVADSSTIIGTFELKYHL